MWVAHGSKLRSLGWRSKVIKLGRLLIVPPALVHPTFRARYSDKQALDLLRAHGADPSWELFDSE